MEPHKFDSYDIVLQKLSNQLDTIQKSSESDTNRNLIISSIAAIASVIGAAASLISLFLR